MIEKQVLLLPGDGIGPEIVKEAARILHKAAELDGINITFSTADIGGIAIDNHGVPLPDTTLAAAQKADAILLGAVGGPKWDNVAPEIRPEKALLKLRQALGLYANLRPIKVALPLMANYSPLRPELVLDTDILIVRELTGGIYFGKRCESEIADGVEHAWDTESYSTPEVERIMRMAFKAAQGRHKHVTSVDKANVLASSRLWRRTAEAVAKDFGDVKLTHMYVDNAAMQLVTGPRKIDVLVTNNIFGDILSDEAAVITGSIGLLPSASLGADIGMYEPIHGSAPDLAGQNVANPIGTILSAAMLLRYSLDAENSAKRIETAVEEVLKAGHRTADLTDKKAAVSTSEMGRLVFEKL